MFAKAYSQNHIGQTDWQVYAEIMRDVQDFLHANMLIPQKLFIQNNGWVEAHFAYPEMEARIEDWHCFEREELIQLDYSSLLPESLYDTTVKINFRLTSHMSRWDRLKQIMS
jgi:hypothetical protein